MQGNTPTASPKQQFGARMELLARDYLEHHGLVWIESNFTLRMGEIDLVMHDVDNDVLIFVEVRYRKNRNFGGPVASVNYRKQQRLRRTANAYLQCCKPVARWARIDVVGLQPAAKQIAAEHTAGIRTSADELKEANNPVAIPNLPGMPSLYRGYEVLWIPNAISG